MNTLIDTYGRVHRNLRVSLTDRCNLRCTYCMPNDFAAWLPSDHQLTTDELVRVIDIAVKEGINEVRLTGGEPLLRPDIVEIVARINAIENAPTLTMTTNALTLEKVAKPLADAGLTRINISLDTLDRDRFKLMTHRDRIDDVFAGIKAAQDAGINPIKINAVLLKGLNADEAPALLDWALTNNLALRFIEQMPLDAGGIWERSSLVTADDIYADLSQKFELTPCDGRGSSPAEEFFVNGGPATVGIIGSVTRPFCGACDRLRLTSDGQLRSCLFSLEEMDLRIAMRSGASDEDIAQRFRKTVAGKLPGHGINNPKFIQPQRPMSAIGG
ncbi:MAG: GTP 3',8-cyclase MoaA [Actinobacteria bacterium]|jgi:GTP 3',8-cyclase|nr:GTP 3',8-cyclase MoaA [Actinomycetota bacterium]